MKQNHTIFEIRLLPYVYETLDRRERRILEGHIRDCIRCQTIIERLVTLKKRMEKDPKPAVQGLWNGVAEAIRQAERKARNTGATAGRERVRITEWVRRRMMTPAGIAVGSAVAALVVAAVVMTAVLGGAGGARIVLVKVSGEVSVNNRPFFQDLRTDYPMNGRLVLGTRSGECVLQLAKEGLLVVSDNTEVDLEGRQDQTITLKKGLIIVRIDRMSQKTEFKVRTPKGEFVARHAVFYVRTDDGEVECGVKEGTLKTFVGQKYYEITGQTRFRTGRHAGLGSEPEIVALGDWGESVFDALADFENQSRL